MEEATVRSSLVTNHHIRSRAVDAQLTMRLMFDTMDAYDRADFDRLSEIYGEDATWMNADPDGPDCLDRSDIFEMFRHGMDAGVHVTFDEMRSTPTHVVLATHVDDSPQTWSVFTFEGRRIVRVHDYRSMEDADAAMAHA
jgi:hypothetical protein